MANLIDNPEMGKRIRDAREAAGLTRDELAHKVGASRTTLQRYESGDVPKGVHLASLCHVLNISADYILFGGPPPKAAMATEGEIDKGFLMEVMTGTFKALKQYNVTLTPAKMTELVFLMYDYCKLDEEGFKPETVERFLRLVA